MILNVLKLVDRVSACLDCHEHIPLDVRHAMMNKYRGPEDPNFKLVSGRIKDVVDKIRADRSLTREEKECMQALSFHYQDQKDINPERVQGTCEWFLKHPKFLAWRRDTVANLLWVTAGPGCGKSVLSKALVDEGLLNPENPDTKTTSICYYFFKDDAERGSGVNALRSILHQLFKQKLWLIQHAINDYSTDGPNLSFGALWAILMKVVSDTNAGPVICVLDALDECETSTRKSLIKNISSFHCASKTTGSTLKFILTSRPYHELDIDFEVDDLPSIHLEGNQMSEEIGGEIDLVISHEISRIGGARLLDGETQASLIQHLQDQKNRTYLWVYLMLQELSKSLESTERKLKELLETIPSSVDEAYEKILKRATDPNKAQKVLCLIMAAEVPLTLKEMNTALEILVMNERGEKCTSENDLVLDKEEAFRKKIVNLCGLFVTIVDSKIYLIHQTAKEFLINKNGSTNPWSHSCWKYTFTLQASHLEALKACLSYLRLDFQDIPSSSRKDHPLLLYASIHWTFHFRQAGEKAGKELVKNALQICNTKTQTFLFWYRILQKQKHGPYNHLPAENTSDLLIACYFGLTSVVQLLLWDKPNIDIESKDTKYDQTPLLWASENGYVEVVKLLLDKEADINAANKDGWTPLHGASYYGHIEVIKLLLDKEANVNAADKDGWTPLHGASSHGHIEVVKLLLDKEADINAANKDGWTPLHGASRNGHEEVVELLLGVSKVKADSKDMWGRTPLSYATEHGHEAIVKFLLKHVN